MIILSLSFYCQPEGAHPTAFGFKRFQRDGHHTVKENPGKKYYDPAEVTVSEQHFVNTFTQTYYVKFL